MTQASTHRALRQWLSGLLILAMALGLFLSLGPLVLMLLFTRPGIQALPSAARTLRHVLSKPAGIGVLLLGVVLLAPVLLLAVLSVLIGEILQLFG